MYSKKAVFHLPGYFKFPSIYSFLLQNYRESPEIFKENVEIGSIHDSPACIWNGGRLMYLPETKQGLEYCKDILNEFNIPMRFTFTNSLIEEKHTYDTYGNLILDIFNTGKNEILCNSPILEKYIRDIYGDGYKYISSTTKRLTEKHEQIAEIDKYYLTVIDYDFNKNFDFLKQMPNPDKCELLCNSACHSHCQFRKEHYENISMCQLNYDYDNLETCIYGKSNEMFFTDLNNNCISIEDIENIYLPMGFKHFKLEGRIMSPLDFIETILYYLIKEEYQQHIRHILHSLVWSIVQPTFPTKY